MRTDDTEDGRLVRLAFAKLNNLPRGSYCARCGGREQARNMGRGPAYCLVCGLRWPRPIDAVVEDMARAIAQFRQDMILEEIDRLIEENETPA